MKLYFYTCICFQFASCDYNTTQNDAVILISGSTTPDITNLSIEKDTIQITNGIFEHALRAEKPGYRYFMVNEKSHILYTNPNQDIELDISEDYINIKNDLFNSFLLNKDSLLIPYSANWNMTEKEFIDTWDRELPINFKRIDDYFKDTNLDQSLISELKDMEQMLRAHITSNFVSFSARKEIDIDESIYDFLDEVDIHNEKFAFHINNRNFQYFYTLAKVPDDIPDSLYPFVAIDTMNSNIKIPSIKDMVLRAVVTKGLKNTHIDHTHLLNIYKENVSQFDRNDDKVMDTYRRIQQLKIGKPAPSIGRLLSINGDSIHIEDLQNKHILISVWGSWCPYCKQELPHLKNLIKKYEEKISMVSITLDTDIEKWQKYITENEWRGIHLQSQGQSSEFEQNYLIGGTNMYYVIDAEGVIRMNNTMKPSSTELDDLLASLK